jgi:hypothetical protein
MDDQIRELLRDIAEDIPPQREVPPTLRPRARRRIAATAGMTVVVVGALALGGVVAARSITASPPGPAEPSPTTVEPKPVGDLQPVWPQTSMEEVRQAQVLADAGDPRYRWQVAPDMEIQVGQHHPGSGEIVGRGIFARFLEEKLGWEGFRWDEAFAHPDGLESGEVVFIRCAPGGTNPMYSGEGDSGCAPTIDGLRYETVKIQVAQLARQGGIWVVTGWEVIEPAEQVAPASDAEIDASLGAFLQARIDGRGAEDLAGVAEDDPLASQRIGNAIPLLYGTSREAAYERSEFDLVEGPVWPSGQMRFDVRLFADGGNTVVEQVFWLARDERGRLRLWYDPQPGGPGTTENGIAVPVEYGFLDGEVTYRAAYPLKPSYAGSGGRNQVAIGGLLPDDDAPRQVLVLVANPRPVGPGCGEVLAPADAETLGRSIGSDPDFEASTPVAVTIGGIPALQMDVVLKPGASICAARGSLLLAHTPFPRGADRARLYLLDLPGGSGARVLAIATITDEDSFRTVLEWAAPVVDSVEFHAG